MQWYHNLGDINWDLEHPHTAESTQMLEDHDLGGLDDIDLDNEDAKSAIMILLKTGLHIQELMQPELMQQNV